MAENDDLFKVILDNVHDGVYFVDGERKITYWNKGAEEITGYREADVIGTHCFHNLLRHVDEAGQELCHTACPLAKTLEDGKYRESEVYLHHKQGHRIPVNVRISPVRDRAGAVVGAVEIFSDNSCKPADPSTIAELQYQAMFDPLTGLGNRRFGEIQLHSRINEQKRYNFNFGILFIDIDHFKRINDNFGHDVGDEVLRMVSRTLSHNLRSLDVISRWGGEEFIAIIAHINSSRQLLSVAEKLKTLMERSSISSGDDIINVTISIGATLAAPDDTDDAIVRRADQLMYESKKKGGNSVSVSFEPEAGQASSRPAS
jgi:diguanylate cyclase (GGDEF)-like protein/PAS domain S-box-containing protein